MVKKGKRNKINKQSTLYEESSDSEGETRYQEMIGDLQRALKEKDHEITALRHSIEELKRSSMLDDGITHREDVPAMGGDLVDQGDMQSELRELRRQVQDLQQTALKKTTTNFSFRDVEDAVNFFTGDDNYSLESWIRDFENTAEIFKWDSLHKFVFARRLLQGTARLTVRSYDVTCWESLKSALRQEFTMEENSATLHARLRSRKKRVSETFQQYYLSITELGRKAKLDDASIIQYIIEGIEDEEVNKAVLYGVSSLHELKKKLEIYAEIRGKMKNKQNTNYKKIFTQERKPLRNAGSRCFNCGDIGHASKNCPKKSNGMKCFSCNNFGHMSRNCPMVRVKDPMPSTSQGIAFIDHAGERPMNVSKLVLINGIPIEATIDTGSDVSFIREDYHTSLGQPQLNNPIIFRGVGSGKMSSLGAFRGRVEIDGSTFEETFHVAAQDVLPKGCILGKNTS